MLENTLVSCSLWIFVNCAEKIELLQLRGVAAFEYIISLKKKKRNVLVPKPIFRQRHHFQY